MKKSDSQWLRRFYRDYVRHEKDSRVLHKQWSYDLYLQGLLGNKPRTWNSYEEIIASGYTGEITMRSKKGIGRSKVKYHIPVQNLSFEMKDWTKQGIQLSEITFNESMPEEKMIIQGEVTNFRGPLYLLYSSLPESMNIALDKDPHVAEGLNALLLLKQSMDASSFADLEVLLEMYPFSTIEFSSFSANVGVVPNRNTVFWEVRDY